jgi:hypothetical protein
MALQDIDEKGRTLEIRVVDHLAEFDRPDVGVIPSSRGRRNSKQRESDKIRCAAIANSLRIPCPHE